MLRRRRPLGAFQLLALAALALAALYGAQRHFGLPTWTSQMIVNGAGTAIDGDSFRLDGREIRLKGIDAPEYAQTCQRMGREVPCGRESAAALRRLLARAPATCIFAEEDRYRRLLAQCRVMGQDIAAALVREGHAVSYGDYLAEEAEARADNRGLWSGTFENPREWRAKHPRAQPEGPPPAGRK